MCSRGLGLDEHPITCDLLTTEIATAVGISITQAINRTLAILLVATPGLGQYRYQIYPLRYITLTNKFHKTVNPPRPPPHWFFESLFLSLSYRFLPAFCEEKKHRGMKTS